VKCVLMRIKCEKLSQNSLQGGHAVLNILNVSLMPVTFKYK
jgi:hypothetical protein